MKKNSMERSAANERCGEEKGDGGKSKGAASRHTSTRKK